VQVGAAELVDVWGAGAQVQQCWHLRFCYGDDALGVLGFYFDADGVEFHNLMLLKKSLKLLAMLSTSSTVWLDKGFNVSHFISVSQYTVAMGSSSMVTLMRMGSVSVLALSFMDLGF
jgi:hypothetical protein